MTKDEELEHLRQENAALREELRQVKEQLQSLQEQQGKDSHNSSLPPSSDRFLRRPKSLRKKSGKKPGGQKGHTGHHLMQVATPDEVVLHQVVCCAHCARDLRDQAAIVPERRQVFDLPPKRVWVVEHRVEEKGCPRCGKLSRAAFPQQVRVPAHYGAGLAALSVYLVQGHFVPYARVAKFLRDVLAVQISAGSIASFVRQCHRPLEPVEAALKATLSQVAVLNQDETGLRVKGTTQYVHVASTPQLTHYGPHPHRGRSAMEAIGISPAFRGISMHDGPISYRAFACEHALCNAHHVRELIFIEETFKQPWAQRMIDLLLDLKEQVHEARARGQPALDRLTC